MPDFSFKKGERLSRKKSISSLFQSGRSVMSYPLRLLYNRTEAGQFPAQVAISVPKRLFKKAVDRNLLKRRIKEAYRLQKPEFYALLGEENTRLNLVIQYQHREILDYQTIQSGLQKGLKKMIRKIHKDSQKSFNE